MRDYFQIDINCDMGEWSSAGTRQGDPLSMALKDSDAAIMPFISSANIACGVHAGDAVSMAHTIRLAMQHGVAVGAHPGYPDPEGFGRRSIRITPDALYASICAQIAGIKTTADRLGARLRHVKPHGALFHDAAVDENVAWLLVKCVKETDAGMMLYGLPGSALELASREAGIGFAAEAFTDRAYRLDGSLLPRGMPGAVLHNVDEMIARTLTLITEGHVLTHGGEILAITADSVCVHGDNPVAPAFVTQLTKILAEAQIVIRAPDR